MKRFERILIKVIVIQFLFLLFVQLCIVGSDLEPYFSKISFYEGVSKESIPEILETMNQ